MTNKLKELEGCFWTNLEELREDIEEKGFWVEELNREYITVYADDEDYEDAEWVINLAGTERTIVIKSIEEIGQCEAIERRFAEEQKYDRWMEGEDEE